MYANVIKYTFAIAYSIYSILLCSVSVFPTAMRRQRKEIKF